MENLQIWKTVEGYEGLYQVSNLGNIKSFKFNKEITLKNVVVSGGYNSVVLSSKNIKTRKIIHRLVALYFVDNPENKPQVNHKDGNKLNNHYTNLEWCTSKENTRHAHNTGLINIKGENHYKSKLTESDVVFIRNSKKSNSELANLFNVDRSNIRYIRIYKSWKHIK